jgi:hypothetical protein
VSREEHLRTATPHFIADVTLYPTNQGGRTRLARLGWGCPCMLTKEKPLTGWDAWLLLDEPLGPGQSRRVGVYCLSDEGARALENAQKFYLWEGGFIGEAQVVPH